MTINPMDRINKEMDAKTRARFAADDNKEQQLWPDCYCTCPLCGGDKEVYLNPLLLGSPLSKCPLCEGSGITIRGEKP